MRLIREQKPEVRWGFSGGFSDTLGIGTDAVQEDARRASPRAVCPACNRVPDCAEKGSSLRGGTFRPDKPAVSLVHAGDTAGSVSGEVTCDSAQESILGRRGAGDLL